MTDRATEAIRQYRIDYKAEHGHYPDNFKARITCFECQVKSLLEHAIITNAAGGNYAKFVSITNYSDEVKAEANKRYIELHES